MNKICSCYNNVIQFLEKLNWLPLLLIRLSMATIFISSGWGKFHNFEKVIGFFTQLGIPFPEFNAYLVASTEFFCGLLILFGLFTRLASVPLIFTMIIAIITAKKAELTGITNLFSLDEFVYMVLFVLFLICGGGKISLDTVLLKFNKCNNSR